MTESIPSSAKFAPAVVYLGQSLPEYPRLFPEWQKNRPTVKYEYFNTRWVNTSVSVEYLKIGGVITTTGRRFTSLYSAERSELKACIGLDW